MAGGWSLEEAGAVSWFPRAAELRTPAQQSEDRLGDLLLQLDAELKHAAACGYGFLPTARLAREALKAIHWVGPSHGTRG